MSKGNAWYTQTNSFGALESIKKRLRHLMEGHRDAKEYGSLLEEIFLEKLKIEFILKIVEADSIKELKDIFLDVSKHLTEKEPQSSFQSQEPPVSPTASAISSRPSITHTNEGANIITDSKKDFFERLKEVPVKREFGPPSDKSKDPLEMGRSIGLNLETDYDYNSAISQVMESDLKKEHKFLLLRFLLEDKFPNMDEDKLEIAAKALWKRVDQSSQ